MTLWELSRQYGAAAAALHERVGQLKRQAEQADSEEARQALLNRAKILMAMWRDTNDIAKLTEHYYERNYYRNAKYII